MSLSRLRIASLLIVSILLSSSAVWAVPGKVRLKNGGWVEGDVLEVQPEDHVTVRIADGTVRQIPWAEVEGVDEQPPPTPAPAPAAAEPAAAPTRSVPLSLDDPNVVDVAFSVEDRKAYLIGMPRTDSTSVAIRFERFVREAQLAGCTEITITIDGVESRLPLQQKTVSDRFATRELTQIKVDLDTIKRMIAAKEVSFDMCGTKRNLTAMHSAPMKRFVIEFERNIGKPVVAYAPPAPQARDYDDPAPSTRRAPRRFSDDDERPPPDGYRDHTGFMLRLTTGLGYASTTETVTLDQALAGISDDLTITISGVAVPFSVDFGGAPSQNFNIHARFSFYTLPSPIAEADGEELDIADEASLTAFMVGGGITYYFMPTNFYLTGVLGVGVLSASNGDGEAEATDAGVALNFDLGKEWWVGPSWGLGLAGRLYFSSNTATNELSKSALSSLMIGVVMSATMQ